MGTVLIPPLGPVSSYMHLDMFRNSTSLAYESAFACCLQNKMFDDAKAMLKEAMQKEQDLLHEREELLQKIDILERFPPGAQGSDPEVTREYQLARSVTYTWDGTKHFLLNWNEFYPLSLLVSHGSCRP